MFSYLGLETDLADDFPICFWHLTILNFFCYYIIICFYITILFQILTWEMLILKIMIMLIVMTIKAK